MSQYNMYWELYKHTHYCLWMKYLMLIEDVSKVNSCDMVYSLYSVYYPDYVYRVWSIYVTTIHALFSNWLKMIIQFQSVTLHQCWFVSLILCSQRWVHVWLFCSLSFWVLFYHWVEWDEYRAANQYGFLRISYRNLSKIRLSGHVQINTEFWKTTTHNAQKQWTQTSMQRSIHLHRIPALFCPYTHALTFKQHSAGAAMNALHIGQVVALLPSIQCMHVVHDHTFNACTWDHRSKSKMAAPIATFLMLIYM